MRVKTVNYDGAEFTFGELTFKQVENFFGGGKKAVLSEVVCAALNNARTDGAAEWTRERIEAEMGPGCLRLLQADILKYCEIEVGVPGEAAAAGG